MTSRQYQRLEKLLNEAEGVTMEQPLLTPQGKQIQADLRRLAVLVTAEKFRAMEREGVPPEERR